MWRPYLVLAAFARPLAPSPPRHLAPSPPRHLAPLRRSRLTLVQAALIVLNHHRWRAVRPHDGRTDKCWNPKWPVGTAAPNALAPTLSLTTTFTTTLALTFAPALARWT